MLMQIFTIVLALIAIVYEPAIAQQRGRGGSSDGGANVVCNSQTNTCRMVEEFYVPNIRGVKGAEEFFARLEFIREHFPDFANEIEKAIAKKTWYLIPSEFDLLRVEQTELRFNTEQAAYQNDHEVFISDYSLARMNTFSAAIKIMHESLMAMQSVRSERAVRIVNARIFVEVPSIGEIQEQAARHGFGVYLTSEQLAELQRRVLADYQKFLQSVLGSARHHGCPSQRADVERDIQRIEGNPTRLARERLDSAHRILTSMGSGDILGPNWISPFGGSPGLDFGLRLPVFNNFHRSIIYAFLFTDNRPTNNFSADFWNLFAEIAAQYIRNATSLLNTDHSSVSITRIAQYLGRLVTEDSFQLREQLLVRNPAFIDLLAIQVRLAGNEEQVQPRGYPQEAEFRRVRPILALIGARLSSVPAKNQVMRLMPRLCENMATLERALSQPYNLPPPPPSQQQQQW